MFDLDTATAAVDRDFSSLLDRLDRSSAAEWARPVRCAGWTVTDLARHVLSACRGQAEGLRRSVAGDPSLAQLQPVSEGDPGSLLHSLAAGRAALLDVMASLDQPAYDRVVPLPFGLLPTAVALQIIGLEYGFHRNDLTWALDGEEPLGSDISSTLLEITPGLLPMLAAGTPVGPAGAGPSSACEYRLEAPSMSLTVGWDGTQWEFAPTGDSAAGVSACAIHGDDSALALYIMGRIPADHPALKTNDLDAARRFKTYFPGP